MSIDLSALTLVDYGAIILLLISGGLATLRGMTRELLGLAGWPISVFAAKFSAPYLEPVLTDLIRIEGISAALAWGVPFVIAVVLWFAFASLVSPGLSKAGLGGLDRWLGFLFGLIRGFFIVLIIYAGAVVVAEGESKLPKMVTEATIAPMLRDSAHLMSGWLPAEMGDRIIDNLPGPSDTTKDIQDAGKTLEKAGDSLGEAGGSSLDLLEDETTN
jgi:membrane protein required for colicin V production